MFLFMEPVQYKYFNYTSFNVKKKKIDLSSLYSKTIFPFYTLIIIVIIRPISSKNLRSILYL